MKKFLEKYNIQIKLCISITIGLIILTAIYYYFIPLTLNYPEKTYATSFQTELENTNYNVQVMEIALCIFAFSICLTLFKTRFLNRCHDMIENPDNFSQEQINEVKNKLICVPRQLLVLQIVIPSIILTLVHTATIGQFGITTLKLFLFITSSMTLYDLFLYIYETNLFKSLLAKLPYDSLDGIKKTHFQSRIYINILPLLIVSFVFISLVGYSHLSKQKGNLINDKYSSIFDILYETKEFSTKEEILDILKNIPTDDTSYLFYKDLDGKFYNINGEQIEFSNFFVKYLNELSDQNNGRVYEYYGYDAGASTKKISLNSQEFLIGIYYNVITTNTIILYLFTIAVFILINFLILYIFAMTTKQEFDIINDSFENIVNDKNTNFKKLNLTSSDEFGKLIILYNKIQEKNQKYIEQLNENQETLMEKQRLASLGQLISGIAHNLKTPIMSISGYAQKVDDLATEYELYIEDEEVTIDDHKEIANDIKENIDKIKAQSQYMSDIISTVKGQAVKMRNSDDSYFTIAELLKRVNILLKHELKISQVYLNISLNIDEQTKIKGDINSLIQVINNIISNAIDSYNGKTNSIIDLTVNYGEYNDQKSIEFHVKDYGEKISDELKNKLFKEMVTTKGKNGTGLGLYMSYSTIRANFNGNIDFVSNDDYTDFIVIIPNKDD